MQMKQATSSAMIEGLKGAVKEDAYRKNKRIPHNNIGHPAPFSLLLTLTDRMAVVPADYVPEPFKSGADYMPEVCRGFLHLQARAYLPHVPPVLLGVHLKNA